MRDQMVEQVKAMVNASLIKRKRKAAAVAVVVVPRVLTEVCVQEDQANIEVNVYGAMRALKGLPLDDVPIDV